MLMEKLWAWFARDVNNLQWSGIISLHNMTSDLVHKIDGYWVDDFTWNWRHDPIILVTDNLKQQYWLATGCSSIQPSSKGVGASKSKTLSRRGIGASCARRVSSERGRYLDGPDPILTWSGRGRWAVINASGPNGILIRLSSLLKPGRALDAYVLGYLL